METPVRNAQRDFDFAFGAWNVHHRRLRSMLCGADDWYEFSGTSRQWPIWNGKGNVEEALAQSPLAAIEGAALRTYDVHSGNWSIYWATASTGLCATPNVGSFNDDGIGEFFAHELFGDRPIVSRYRWIVIDRDHCRWEQHFSADEGSTWELNWVMEFTRA
jgi:hypothetical protein